MKSIEKTPRNNSNAKESLLTLDFPSLGAGFVIIEEGKKLIGVAYGVEKGVRVSASFAASIFALVKNSVEWKRALKNVGVSYSGRGWETSGSIDAIELEWLPDVLEIAKASKIPPRKALEVWKLMSN